MDKKLLKMSVEMENGEIREFSGEGVVLCALTDNDDRTEVSGGVIGKFNMNAIRALIRWQQEAMGDEWMAASAMIAMEKLLGKTHGTENIIKQDMSANS